MRRSRGLLSLVPLVFLLQGCPEAARPLGSGPGGKAAADDLAVAIATRFGPIERGPAFDAARSRLARAALAPSRVFDEREVWTAREADVRQLDLFGHRDGEKYSLDMRPSAPPPRDAGDYRGLLRLNRVEKGRFEWTMREELAVGAVRPSDVADAVTGLLRSAEGVSEEEARAHAVQAFPRAAEVLSRLFRLETLELTAEGGATAIRLGLRLEPDGMEETAPHYAAFLKKWAAPMRMSAVATDATGASWWSVQAADMLWTVRLRVRDGSLVPLEGRADRRVPDELTVAADYSMKAGPFTIGVRDLVVDVTLTRAPGEKGYVAHYRQEPDWRLPFLIKPFLRGSLRYPFEGPGSSAGYSVRESTGGPTEFVREFRFRVRESWIIRWLGGRGNEAMSDFRKGAEIEADRYNQECLYALRDDVMALLDHTPRTVSTVRPFRRSKHTVAPSLSRSHVPDDRSRRARASFRGTVWPSWRIEGGAGDRVGSRTVKSGQANGASRATAPSSRVTAVSSFAAW